MDKKMKSTVKDSNPEPSTDYIRMIVELKFLRSRPAERLKRLLASADLVGDPSFSAEDNIPETIVLVSSAPLWFQMPREVSIRYVLETAADPVNGGSYSGSFSSLYSDLNNTPTTPKPETESFILNNSSEIQLWSEPPNEILSDAQAIDDPNIYPAGDVAIDIPHILRVLNLDQKKSAIIPEDSREFLKLREIFLGLTGQAAISLMAYAQPMEASASSSSSPPPPPPPNARLYILVATNAIAFVLCFISFLLQNRKPVVAKIMEAIGSVVAAVAFFFMMAMFLPV